jgi:hypothetical protein
MTLVCGTEPVIPEPERPRRGRRAQRSLVAVPADLGSPARRGTAADEIQSEAEH